MLWIRVYQHGQTVLYCSRCLKNTYQSATLHIKKMARFLMLLALLGITLRAHSAPNPKSGGCASPLTFDDLPQNAQGFDPYIDPVSTYGDIYFQGFTIATQQNQAAEYFIIPSPPNIINSGTISQDLFGGTSALVINTTAAHKPSATFSLGSLQLACLVTNGIYTSNAEGCTVLFEGIKRNSKTVTYEYEYPNQNTNSSPIGPPTPFGDVTLPKTFTGLTEVFLTLTDVQNGVLGVNILLDNVCVTVS
ncbi:hypothetical protein ABVK25_011468 [Lepraria finkii]|uniref:Uncharacterized protein n=1 Tax=Lepraria finkii TaxID=1340010 RepID=A0ABR4APL8_9LECA